MFCIVTIIFSLFVGIYFLYGLGIVKHLLIVSVLCFGIGPCPFILYGIDPCPFTDVTSIYMYHKILIVDFERNVS